MKRIFLIILLLGIIICFPGWAGASQTSGAEILAKVDQTANAPKDQTIRIKLILIDKNSQEEVRELIMLQKGSDKRLAKFLAPADQKGIGFLALPEDVMYVYLPAFKKTRRIASHIKNNRFAGTDFTYEDMETRDYSTKWNPMLLKSTDEHYVLKLSPKPDTQSEYAEIRMWVRIDNCFPTKIEYFDRSKQLYKILYRTQLEKIKEYWVARESEMQDVKNQHRTKMIILEAKFDSALSDQEFSERYLSR